MTHQQIVEYLDKLECELYTKYIQLRRKRIELQKQWNVTPHDRQNDERDME